MFGGMVYISFFTVYILAANVNMDLPRIHEICQREGKVTSTSLAEALGISRQAAHRQLAAAVSKGELEAVGAGRGRYYTVTNPRFRFPLDGAEEDLILRVVEERIGTQLESVGSQARDTFHYVFTEMVNNAIDHSRGQFVEILVNCGTDRIEVTIEDDGIGAFESVRTSLRLATHVESAAELTKGKVTSMPDRHTGEGLFFASRVAGRFSLSGNGLEFISDNSIDDLTIRESDFSSGTRVRLRIDDPPHTTIQEVFEAHQDEFEFSKTRTVVRLFGLGRDFVSRSEARRLLHGLDAFKEVVVDFRDVAGVGQGFADEVFRVWAQRHPEVLLIPVNMVEPVRFFVERAERKRENP